MDECRRWPLQLGKVDGARRAASGALNLEQGVAAVKGLRDVRAGINRTAFAPHPFIPALAKQVIGLTDQTLALLSQFGGSRRVDRSHGLGATQLFGYGLPVTAAERRGSLHACEGSRAEGRGRADHCGRDAVTAVTPISTEAQTKNGMTIGKRSRRLGNGGHRCHSRHKGWPHYGFRTKWSAKIGDRPAGQGQNGAPEGR